MPHKNKTSTFDFQWFGLSMKAFVLSALNYTLAKMSNETFPYMAILVKHERCNVFFTCKDAEVECQPRYSVTNRTHCTYDKGTNTILAYTLLSS